MERHAGSARLTRDERRARTRELLLDAAAGVFNRLGYHGASLEAVAEAAGFTKGAVYSNFATKAELFMALSERVSGDRSALVARAFVDLPLSEFLEGMGPYLRDQAATEGEMDLLSIEFWLAAMRDPVLRGRIGEDNARFRAELRGLLEEKLRAEGARPPFSGDELALLLKVLGDGLLLQYYADPDGVDTGIMARAFRVLAGLPAAEAPAVGGERLQGAPTT